MRYEVEYTFGSNKARTLKSDLDEFEARAMFRALVSDWSIRTVLIRNEQGKRVAWMVWEGDAE